jgi:hypothetical protein
MHEGVPISEGEFNALLCTIRNMGPREHTVLFCTVQFNTLYLFRDRGFTVYKLTMNID